jgi:hypothetical protein
MSKTTLDKATGPGSGSGSSKRSSGAQPCKRVYVYVRTMHISSWSNSKSYFPLSAQVSTEQGDARGGQRDEASGEAAAPGRPRG